MKSLLLEAYAGTYNPTFPKQIVETSPHARETQREMIVECLRELFLAHRKHVRWLEKCDAYNAGMEPPPPTSAAPSHTAKARMYDCSRCLSILCGWDPVETLCGSLGDISKQMDAVEAALKNFL